MARVLVVDDDADIRVTVEETLKLAGYDAAGAATGAAALAEINRQLPDLVLLDWMLPDVDGPEVCRRLRRTHETARVPIVFLTARTDEEARVGGFALGADDYIVKPFSVQELRLRIRAVLRRATPVQLRLPPRWLHLRDQFRVWNGYAEIHHTRGEWRDCVEVSRSILQSCEEALTPLERVALFERLALCAHHLGDEQARRAWYELARAG